MRRVRFASAFAGLALAASACSFAGGGSPLAGAGRGDARVPSGPVQVVVWSSRPLPQALYGVASGIPGVIATATRRTGIVDLLATVGSTRPMKPRPAGTVVPVSVSTLTDGLVGAFPDLLAADAALRRGEAVLHEESAAYRGLEVGDALDLAGTGNRKRVRVGAIVEDRRLTGNEVILSDATGRPLGVVETQALIMAVEADKAAAAEARMTQAIGTFPARIRSSVPGARRPSSPPSASSGGLLSLLEVKKTFGEFWYRPHKGIKIEVDPAWVAQNIVYARIPVLGVVQCNRKITPLLAGAMREIEQRGLASLVRAYNGCWNPRMQTFDSDALSRHAFGIAIDINAATNGYDKTPTMDMRVVEVMERWGFTWGGRWTIPDGMHFEFAGFPEGTPGVVVPTAPAVWFP